MLSDHARKAAEYLDGFIAKPSVKIAESIIANAIADATAEQGRRAEELIAKWRAEADQQQQWQETLVMGALRRVADELEAALNKE
jgi:hypothetical protein